MNGYQAMWLVLAMILMIIVGAEIGALVAFEQTLPQLLHRGY